MRIKIFYKFFIIIFSAFLLVEYINIKIDYETTLNYKLGLYANRQEKELSEQFASFMKDKTLTEEEFFNEFHRRFDHEGYCYHMLVKDQPFDFKTMQDEKWAIYHDDLDEYLLEYDKDEIVLSHHGVKYIEPYTTYLNTQTGELKTYNYVAEIGNTFTQVNNGVFSNRDIILYEAENSDYSYGLNGHHGIYSENAILVKHGEYRDICKEYLNEYQLYKNYTDVQSFYEIYGGGVIFITKTYIASSTGNGMYSKINEEIIDYTHNTENSFAGNEGWREIEGIDDYYVVSCFYMDSLSLISEINQEINERNNIVYICVLFVSFFVSLFLSWMLSRHIKHISAVTKQIANSDFSVRLKEYSYDELGTLSANINTMSQKLEKTMADLNNEIERVKQLEGVRKEFIANFTHEIKTPLSIINGYIELINKSDDEIKKEGYLNAIQKETGQINHLVMAMLELSRLEAGKIDLNKQEVDLEDLTSDILENFLPLLRQKQIKIRVNVNDDVILADRKEIEKVIRNFLSNAIHHATENGRIIIIHENNIFSVENEGEHISEEAMKDVFETYVSRNREGTGLGLAICKAILELHQFDYGVKNTENGVCFWFEVK